MIKNRITDPELLSHLKEIKDDKREIFLLENGQVRVTGVSTTTMLNEMKMNHKTGVLETYVLGQAYIAGALLTSCVKGNDRLIMDIECGGPIRGLSVESWAVGAVRGYLVENPIPLKEELTSLDTSMLYGPGFLSITKYLEGHKTPVTGTVMMGSGNLANDLAQYFHESEQTPTLFYLSIQFDKKGDVAGAGGVFIQAMPGCKDEVLESLQDFSKNLPSLGDQISKGISIKEYIQDTFKDYNPESLGSDYIGFSCPCKQESFTAYLSGLPQKEKEEILKGTFPLNLVCFNCGTTYSYTKEELETLFRPEEK